MALTYVDMSSVIEVQVNALTILNLRPRRTSCHFIRKISKSFLFQRSASQVTAAELDCRAEVRLTPATRQEAAEDRVDCHRVSTVTVRACTSRPTSNRHTSLHRFIIHRRIRVRHSSSNRFGERKTFGVKKPTFSSAESPRLGLFESCIGSVRANSAVVGSSSSHLLAPPSLQPISRAKSTLSGAIGTFQPIASRLCGFSARLPCRK